MWRGHTRVRRDSDEYKEVGVAFPDESLAQGEEVKLHLHPHWIVMVAPAFWTAVAIGGVITAAIFTNHGTNTTSTDNVILITVGALALVLFVWLAFAPFVVWRSTHFVFTNKQVMFRHGVFSREERGIPLNKVNDVKATQKLWERMLGCGTLTVESAGEHGQSELDDIPRVIKVMNVLKELVEHDHDRNTLDEDELRTVLKENREAGGHL
jgi:uncharacterized membrane protein YdbT with pleckstrin-like domain